MQVMGISHSLFEEKLEELKASKEVKQDTELTAADLKELVQEYRKVYVEAKGEQFPIGTLRLLKKKIKLGMIIITLGDVLFGLLCLADPKKQLYLAVLAVFDSWNSPRAIKYRSINQISGLKGTAVNIQCMVFGNMGSTSGTGVLFTRNPSTGEKKLYGEFLINAQARLTICNSLSLKHVTINWLYECYYI